MSTKIHFDFRIAKISFMKLKSYLYSLAVSLLLCPAMYAQTYNAMILSLEGNGIIKRGADQIAIELPQSYLPGDELSVQNGNAVIMLFSGEEIPLSAVSYYTIPDAVSADISAISTMANSNTDRNLLSQSGTAYQIRGKSKVFPMNSKAYSVNNIILRLNYKNMEEQEVNLRVINSLSQKVLFEKHDINDSIISLSEVPFEAGKSYYWTIDNTPTGKPEMGTIILSKESETASNYDQLPETHFETINTISDLYNNKYYFEAYALLTKAIKTYPKFEIYQKMLLNILSE